MSKTLSRRSFLRGAAVGAFGAAASTILPGAAAAEAAVYTPGTYTASADGFGGPVTVTMTFSETEITEVTVEAAGETATVGGAAAPQLAEAIKAGQTPLVDGVSGATMTSNATKRAAAQCVAQAKGVDVEAILSGAGTAEEAADDGEDWIGTAPEIDESQITETLTCDMLIVGAGNGGLAAAAKAADLGMDFIVAEKAAAIQSTRHWFGAIDSHYTAEAGVRINRLQLENELMRYSSGKADPRVIKMWANESGATADYLDAILTSYGYVCEFTSDTGAAPGEEDAYTYSQPIQHYYSAGPDCPEEYKSLGRNGVLKDYIEKKGYSILFNRQLVTLVKDGDRVVGGIFQDTENKNYVKILANKGVLLATGGYPANFEMLAKRDPVAAGVTSLSYYGASDTGDGIKAAAWAGAALDPEPAPMLFDRGLVAPGQDAGQIKDEFGNWIYAGTGKQWNPTSQPFLKVNRFGERVYNEENPYNDGPYLAYSQPGRVLCQIFDNNFPDDVTRFHTMACSAQTRQQLPRFWGTDGTDGEIQQKVDAGIIQKADTLEELADKLGFDAESKKTFLETCAHYNEMYDAGADTEFGKAFYRMSSLRNPPFFGSWYGASLLTTIDGIRINAKTQALAAGTMKPIPGLYACGDCSGSFFANNYPELFPGVAVGRTMTEAIKAVKQISGTDEA